MKVNLVEQKGGLVENGQVYSILFALANVKDGVANAVIPLCKCRDYLVDVIYANAHGEPEYTIYGMKYNASETPLDPDSTGFIIKFENVEQCANFKKHIGLIHAIEDFNKFERTVIHPVDDTMVVTVGDSYWSKTCLAVNIYSMLMKLCAYNIDKSKSLYSFFSNDNQRNNPHRSTPAEVTYINTVGKNYFEFVLQNLRGIIEDTKAYVNGFDEETGIETVHSYSGIIAAHRYTTYYKEKPTFYQRMKENLDKFKLDKELFSKEALG